MNEARKQFAERLLACDPSPSKVREDHERKLRIMMQHELTTGGKREWVAGAIGCTLLAAMLSHVGVEAMYAHTPEFHLPAFIGVYMFLTAAVLVSVGVILAVGVWRGGYRRALHRQVVGSIGIVYVGLTGGILMVGSRYAPEQLRNDFFVLGLVLVLYGATAWIRKRVTQSELTTREKLLEIELQVATIAESLAAPTRRVSEGQGDNPR